jgi:hypothetical protein
MGSKIRSSMRGCRPTSNEEAFDGKVYPRKAELTALALIHYAVPECTRSKERSSGNQ